MSKENIYKFYTENEQLKRLAIACGKLSFSCGEMRTDKNTDNLNYLIRKMANVEFLLDQIKDNYKCADAVYIRKFEIEKKLLAEINQQRKEDNRKT